MGDFYYVLSSGTCDIVKHGKVVLKVRGGARGYLCGPALRFAELCVAACILPC